MNISSRYLLILSSLILTLVQQSHAADEQKSTLKIGATLAMTGPAAIYGEWAKRGALIAIDEVNQKGGIRDQQVALVIEDNQGQPAEAVTTFRKLRDIDKISYLLSAQSSIGLALSPLCNKRKVVMMDVSSTTPKYSSRGDYTFRTSSSATDLARAAASSVDLLTNRAAVAALYIQNDFGEGMHDVFKQQYPGEIVFSESFTEETTDFKALLLRAKQRGAEVIWLVSHVQTSGVLVRQAHQLGLSFQFITDVYSVEAQEFIDVAGEAAEGIRYVAPQFRLELVRKAAPTFFQAYQAKYGEEPNYLVAQSYDGARALLTAIGECATTSEVCVLDALGKIAFTGASGRIDFDEFGDVKKEIAVKQIKGQSFEYLDLDSEQKEAK